MSKLRRLSGREVISFMGRFGFQILARKGSHVKLRRVTPEGQVQTLTIPDHKELDTGTCRAIWRQATRYVPESELRSFFVSP